MTEPLYVTKPMLPPIEELHAMTNQIWKSGVVTNGGPLHQRLEADLRIRLGVPTAMLFNNGTIALISAIKLLNLPTGSEVITTPFTFAATAHAISWNNLKPVFADVLPGTLTLDPRAAVKAITSNTSALLGVHVYGNACEVEELQNVADNNGLRLIYDAAHAFGTHVNDTPIGMFGDASIFSFHATKLFHTLEGGLVTTPRQEDGQNLYFLRNFGIKSEEEVVAVGINGKMNEIQAAIGLLNLPKVFDERKARAGLRKRYDAILKDLPGIELQTIQHGVTRSEQYYPVVIDQSRFKRTRDQVYNDLKVKGIFSRKYFHPICTDFEPYRGMQIVSDRNTPLVETVKSQVLCLPFFSGVTDEHIEIIREVFYRKA